MIDLRIVRLRLGAVVSVLTVLALVLPPTPGRADARGEARRHFQRGMELIQEGEVADGIDELRIAHAILPHPNVLYNIGRASLEIGRYDEAVEAWEGYLASGPDDEAEVRQLIAAVERRQQDQAEASQEAAAERSAAEAAAASAPTGPPVDVEAASEVAELTQESARILRRFRSPSIRRRAARLNELASELQVQVAEAERAAAEAAAARAAAAEAPAAPAPVGLAATPGGDGSAPEDGGGASGAQGMELLEEAVYDERVISASQVAESPLDAPNSTTVVTAQDIRLSGLVGMVPLGELLRRAAGVEVMTLGPAGTDVSIRGLNQRRSNKVLVLVDGRRVNLDFIGAPDWELVPVVAGDIERIEIIRGPASAVYGADAFSGVVNILTKETRQGGGFASAGVGTGDAIHVAGSVAAREGDVRFRVSGGYDRRDQWALEVGDDRADLTVVPANEDVALERAVFDVDASIDLSDDLTLEMGNGLAAAELIFYSVSRFRQSFGDNTLFNQAHASLSSDQGFYLRTYWSFFGIDVSQIQQPPAGVPTDTRIDSNVIDVDVGWTGTVELGVPQDISIGAGYEFKRIDWDWIGGTERQNHFNVFVQDVIRVHERFRVHVSARLDRHPLLDGLQFSPRAALVGRPTPNSSLRLMVARAFRSPTFLESYLELQNPTPVRAITAVGRGNENLDPERITSVELGYTSQDLDWLTLEANVYVNFVDDLILLAALNSFGLEDFASGGVGFDPAIGAFPVGELQFSNDPARVRQVGGELGARVNPVDGLDVYANYAVHDTTPVGDRAAASFLSDDRRTSRHKVNGGIQYRSPIGIDAAVDVHWVDDQRWAQQVSDPVTGVRFQSFPIRSYTLVNASLGYRLFDDHLELGLSGYDLLDQGRRQHPFGQPVGRRLMGRVTGRF